MSDDVNEVVSLAELWGEHSPMIASVEHARYIQRIARNGFGTPGGKLALHRIKLWESILVSLSHEHIRLLDKIQAAEWLGIIRDLLKEQ